VLGTGLDTSLVKITLIKWDGGGISFPFSLQTSFRYYFSLT
jgi:hypothetical protein